MLLIYFKAISPIQKVTGAMMSSKMLINAHALIGGTPAEILDRVNKQICSNNKAHMFVTVWLGIIDISTGKIIAASAGHEYPMINTNGKFELLKDPHGMPVGSFKKSKYKDYELTLKKGDSLFLYTDGVAKGIARKFSYSCRRIC